MICPACGAANEDGVLFCEKCKADLDMPAATPSPQVPAMNDRAAAEEPIALEPIALERVGDVAQPAAFEPAAVPAEQPIVLEPVVESPLAERTKEDAATKPKTAVPPPVAAATVPTSPKLLVVRGQRMEVSYPIYPGKNYLGRTDDKPVDIDLEDQESSDRIWTSRQHAVVTFENDKLTVEDLNSLNGTFVNRTRVHPGQLRELTENDVLQVGTVHLKVTFS
jgi:FHA domain